MFKFVRRVNYHETDGMAIVHHSNHVKFFEEARVDLLEKRGIYGRGTRLPGYQFAVLKQDASYYRPLRFGDELEVFLECRLESAARLTFRYAIFLPGNPKCHAEGSTVLVPLGENFKPKRLPDFVEEVITSVGWSAQWPPETHPEIAKN